VDDEGEDNDPDVDREPEPESITEEQHVNPDDQNNHHDEKGHDARSAVHQCRCTPTDVARPTRRAMTGRASWTDASSLTSGLCE
jgi:hypothetical protein